MDNLTKEQRSAQMRLIGAFDTGPELTVRRLVHGMGFRYGLHSKDVPGRPDLVLRSRRKAIFVHGCFWHRHACAAGQRTPKSRTQFWTAKFEKNVARDRAVRSALRKLGWQSCVIWECQVTKPRQLATRIRKFLDAWD